MQQKSIFQKLFEAGIIAMLFATLCFSFYSSSKIKVDEISEDLIFGPLYARMADMDIAMDGYGLGRLKSEKFPSEYVYDLVNTEKDPYGGRYSYSPYTSQVGLQGKVWLSLGGLLSGLGSKFKRFNYICQFEIFACIVLCMMVVALIVWQLYKRYGILYAIVFGIVTISSPRMVFFSASLYWVEFTWFIPMLLGLLVLNYEKRSIFIYPFFYLALLAKCLCGYEYLSTIMMSGIMFLIAECFQQKEKRCKLLKHILIIGILSLLGFLSAYMIHAYMFGDGDIMHGLRLMQVYLIGRRTYGNAAEYPSVYSKSLNASVLSVLWRYIGFGSIYGMPMLFLFLLTLAVLIYRRSWMREGCRFEVTMFAVTLLSALSWFILAKAHSYIHIQLNYGLFYMGWVQVCVYIIVKTFMESHAYVIKKGQYEDIRV